MAEPEVRERCSVTALMLYLARLGTVGFGGPIALAGYMQRDLVEERKWIAPEDYKQGLALSQLAPGPLAAQLAIYLGWVRAGTAGATLAGLVFVLPSFLMVIVLSEAYVRLGGLSAIQGLFYGMGAAVIAIIARAAVKLAQLTAGKDRLLWTLFWSTLVVTAATGSEIVWLFLASGLVAVAAKTWRPGSGAAAGLLGVTLPPWLVTGTAGPASGALLAQLGMFFAKAGSFVFGSGLAIVPFLHQGVVETHHWLTERQFLDAVAVAMITPGPVVITAAFVGYLVAGLAGAVVTALGVFLPCWAVVVLLAPWFRRHAESPRVRAFVAGVTAAAAGAIGGAALVLARRSLVDMPTVAISAVTLALTLRFKKLSEPLLVVLAGLVGLALSPAVH